MSEYTLSFSKAISKVLNKDELIIGEEFNKGFYLRNSNGIVTYCEKIVGYGFVNHGPIPITSGLLNQKYKVIACATNKCLNLLD